MRDYLIRRLLLLIPTLFIVTIIVFLTVRLIPGDIIDIMMGEFGGEERADMGREELEEIMGLDMPFHVQYGRWIGDIILHGSLGKTLHGQLPISDRIIARLPVTFELGLMGLMLGLLIALPIGIYSAIRQDSWGDYVGRSIAIIFISVPSFWVASIVMIYPAIWWGWSPPVKLIHFSDDPAGNLGMFIIPAFILGMLLCGTTMRMTRTMMLEVLRQDYIRTAWSKGLKERVIVARHAMKSAFIPIITIVGMQVPILVGGAVIIEQIFAMPGMGTLMLEALRRRDYPLVSGINLFIAAAIIVINLLVDLTYGYLDPRVRYR